MRRTRVEKKQVEETVTDDILCNQCGNSLKPARNDNFHGLIEAEVFGGYGATLGDQEMYKFSICEPCLRKLFAGFVLPVEHWDNMGDHRKSEKEHKAWLAKVDVFLEKKRDAD
jgi:uncharacterized protein with PIN domain